MGNNIVDDEFDKGEVFVDSSDDSFLKIYFPLTV